MKLFALNASRAFGQRVARGLGIELATHEEREFEDTEFKVRSLESVRGEQIFVCHSLHAEVDAYESADARSRSAVAADTSAGKQSRRVAGADPRAGAGSGRVTGATAHAHARVPQSASDKLCRLLFFLGALKDAGAAELVAVVPYLAYARKDRRTKPRDPVTTRYVATLFEAVGTDLIVTMDVHNVAAFDNAFRCGKQNLEAAPLLLEHFRQAIAPDLDVVVLSPDAGGVKRARTFATLFASARQRPVPLAFMAKARSEGRVSGEAFAGDVRGAAVIVVDDLVSSGTTLVRAARACMERGAREVHAAATHGVFAQGAASALAVPELASIVVTDTAGDPRRRCASLGAKLVVLDAAPLFAAAIERLARG